MIDTKQQQKKTDENNRLSKNAVRDVYVRLPATYIRKILLQNFWQNLLFNSRKKKKKKIEFNVSNIILSTDSSNIQNQNDDVSDVTASKLRVESATVRRRHE